MYTRRANLLNSLPYRYASPTATTQPSPIRINFLFLSRACMDAYGRGRPPAATAGLRTLFVRAVVGKHPPPPGAAPFFDGRAFGPPLCRGCAPATPPSKNMPHRPLRLHTNCASQPTWRPPTEYAIRYPEWQPGRKAGQDRLCILLSSCAQYKKSPPSGELCNRLIPSEEIRPTHKCPDGCLVIAGDASSIRYRRNWMDSCFILQRIIQSD